MDVPGGFAPFENQGPFLEAIDPVQLREGDGPLVLGLRAEERHANHPAKPGDRIESRTRVDRVGSTLSFADCSLEVEGKEIVRARAVWVVAGQR